MQKIFFWTWISSLYLFSLLTVSQNLLKKPWQNDSELFLVISIVIGIIAFVLNSLLGIILRMKKIKHVQYGIRSYFISIIWGILFIGGMMLWSPGAKNIPAHTSSQSVTTSPTPSLITSPKPSIQPTAKPKTTDTSLSNTDAEWGKATKNSDGTYTMKIQMDDRMSTVPELFEALNNYRNTKGKSSLAWDERLASYAQERANYICANGGDGHAGFYKFLEEGGYDKLGFNGLGENQGRMKLIGVHLVEWMYAQSPGHERNQLGPWSHAGVGITEYCSVVIFGGGKM